jgi:probable F420-dependent oxidoreductase
MVKVGTSFGGGWLNAIKDDICAAEALGYDFASTVETSHDSMLAATIAAEWTSRMELQTAVTIAFPRSPTVLAMEAWDIQHLSQGKFTLGLGSQVKGHNEQRFSVEWPGAPATRMKEYIRMIRAVWDSFRTGRKPDYIGKYYHFTLMTPNFNPGPIDYRDPKIGLAIVGDAMARVAGEVADVVIPHGFMTDRYMREVVLPNIQVGLDRAHRSWQDIEVFGGGFTVFGETESEIEREIDKMRKPIAFYGSTRSYHRVFELHGLLPLGMQLHEMSLKGQWNEMPSVIPESVLRTFVQSCTYDRLPQFIAEKREYASRLSLRLPTASAGDAERAKAVIELVQTTKVPGRPRA